MCKRSRRYSFQHREGVREGRGARGEAASDARGMKLEWMLQAPSTVYAAKGLTAVARKVAYPESQEAQRRLHAELATTPGVVPTGRSSHHPHAKGIQGDR